MARIRSIKPEFWTDGAMVQLSPWARLFYIGMWNFACDRGHLADDAMALKLRILPADPVDAEGLLDELVKSGRVERLTTEAGRAYLWIRRLSDHQKLDARWQSRCPYCVETSPTEPAEPPPNSRESERATPRPAEPPPRKGKDGSGVEKKTPSESSAADKPQRRGTRIPDDFAVTPEMVAWARENVPDVDGRRETEKFMNHWRGKSGRDATKLDWIATWRNWMLNAEDRMPSRPGSAVAIRGQPSTSDRRVADALALKAKFGGTDHGSG